MPHVFISYAKKDTRELALKLDALLEATGNITSWKDNSLEVGESWAQQIQAEINRADLVVVLLSPDVNRPETDTQRISFVHNEINYAQSLHKPILPVMAMATQVPIQLAGLQYVDISNNPQAQLPRLVQEIQTRLQVPGASAAMSSVLETRPAHAAVAALGSAVSMPSGGQPARNSTSQRDTRTRTAAHQRSRPWLLLLALGLLAGVAVTVSLQWRRGQLDLLNLNGTVASGSFGSAPAPGPGLRPDARGTVTVNPGNNLNLRTLPDTKAPVIALIGSGSTVGILGRTFDARWLYVEFGGLRGWVSARWVQADRAGQPIPAADIRPLEPNQVPPPINVTPITPDDDDGGDD